MSPAREHNFNGLNRSVRCSVCVATVSVGWSSITDTTELHSGTATAPHDQWSFFVCSNSSVVLFPFPFWFKIPFPFLFKKWREKEKGII